MAIRYAVGSGLWSNTTTVWSDTDGGAPGSFVPVDGDSAVILEGINVQVDVDQSAWTGMVGITIRGSASGTPAMLYWKDNTSGHLKLRTGGYSINGTNVTNKGRLLANSDGVWGNTGSLTNSTKAVITVVGNSRIDGTYLTISMYGTEPSRRYVRTYGTKYDFTASGSTVDTTNDTIDIGTTPPAADTAIMFHTASGTLPAPLKVDHVYWIRSVSGNTFKVSSQKNQNHFVNLTSTGSGTVSVLTGHTSTSTGQMNILEDVTADAPWSTTSDHNRVILVNPICSSSEYQADFQRVTLTALTSSTLTLSANVNSAQNPGARVYLVSRNVSARSTSTSSADSIFNMGYLSGSVLNFRGEINATAGSSTTFTPCQGIVNGGAHTIEGVLSCNSIQGCHGSEFRGLYIASYSYSQLNDMKFTSTFEIAGAEQYAISGNNVLFEGKAFGCDSVFYAQGSKTIKNAEFFGCEYVSNASSGSPLTIIGTTVRNCVNPFYTSDAIIINSYIYQCVNAISGGRFIKMFGGGLGHDSDGIEFKNANDFSSALTTNFKGYGVKTLTPPSVGTRNTSVYNGNYGSCLSTDFYAVSFEDYGQTLGASLALLPTCDVLKQSSVVRSGGAATALEVTPLSYCSSYQPAIILDWTELNVPASAQNKSVYIRADAAWSTYPTASELWFEAEYISNATTFARSTKKSTAVLSDGSTWVEFETGSFTPSAAGHVRYRLWLTKYEASRKIYVDAQMQDT